MGRPPVHGGYSMSKRSYAQYDSENYIAGIKLRVRGTQPGVKRGPYKKRQTRNEREGNVDDDSTTPTAVQQEKIKHRFDDSISSADE